MRARGLALIAFVAIGAACQGAPAQPEPAPTEAEARGHLEEVVAIALGGNPDGVCALSVATCAQTLEKAIPGSAPATAPEVIATRLVDPKVNPDGSVSSSGRVLSLCGQDGLGQPYYSEMLVFRDGDRLLSVNTPFWLGYTYADSGTTGEVDPHRPCPDRPAAGATA